MKTEPRRRGRRKLTAREAAAKLGVSERTIRYYMAEERSAYEGRAKERRSKIVEMHRQGMKGHQIAKQLGISQGLVSTRLREARELGELAS